ncbi:L-ascorbate metabolism protein UlaG (beta-lactamase superfamily) [Algoriphagus sp. 4150]|uniref:MBL fold metallo-hydrolase n=1 Tax=Algoriphagus sp. 4150 TaxID=2817756 RepID=UPI00285AA102|nr:MBL fold metallo-hydrolase [Algoriphagus sp. 4150]MDR7128197.1 L-ascorbate metabolism protein UlaG (beta-lactamase superfamily) [Algoriphagus sp. 4150]
MITLISIVLILLLVVVLFVNFNPEFGGSPSKQKLAQFEKLDYFEDGKFSNLMPTNMDMDFAEAIKMLPEFFKNDPTRRPGFDLPLVHRDALELVTKEQPTRLVWFGHSTFLLQMDGKTILIDPMFGEVPAPNPILGKKRFSNQLPIAIEKLPQIDMIIMSHDHYDHLDYGSIQKLKGKTKAFYMPLGMGAHFEEWGVDSSQIHELGWWDEIQADGLLLALTPARHFSGRGLNNRFSTLWGSWVIRGESDNIYFSGDSGYGPHFKQIGEKYGPFDFAMMECGQYNERWKDIHMMPEETAQAAKDINAKVFMPIHWAAFTLAMHSWTDPVERVIAKADEINQPIFVPEIGEFIELEKNLMTKRQWWLAPSSPSNQMSSKQ